MVLVNFDKAVIFVSNVVFRSSQILFVVWLLQKR